MTKGRKNAEGCGKKKKKTEINYGSIAMKKPGNSGEKSRIGKEK